MVEMVCVDLQDHLVSKDSAERLANLGMRERLAKSASLDNQEQEERREREDPQVCNKCFISQKYRVIFPKKEQPSVHEQMCSIVRWLVGPSAVHYRIKPLILCGPACSQNWSKRNLTTLHVHIIFQLAHLFPKAFLQNVDNETVLYLLRVHSLL